MNPGCRRFVALACLAIAGSVLAQAPPSPPPVAPPPVLDPAAPPVLDPQVPPVRDPAAPVDPTHADVDAAARRELERARLQCQTLPEQQRQACLDAARHAFEQARRRGDAPVR